MMTTAQRMQRLIDELTKCAISDEDKERAERMQRCWTQLQEKRMEEDLHILMLLEGRREEDERFDQALNEVL
ncbi:hypothetical protein FTW19_11565 [Terriglobus albidus]|uniref:Uncharacterized protein n=1 Tax=Terriglobus albidus TaxID=1592106 RepID=A0A5B9E8Z7_9BACT|nr:hypothetical protein [Terriglobus albidus]QEE28578.1 hypothetical protein FTW19_11565 [Terriglobus albidus]